MCPAGERPTLCKRWRGSDHCAGSMTCVCNGQVGFHPNCSDPSVSSFLGPGYCDISCGRCTRCTDFDYCELCVDSPPLDSNLTCTQQARRMPPACWKPFRAPQCYKAVCCCAEGFSRAHSIPVLTGGLPSRLLSAGGQQLPWPWHMRRFLRPLHSMPGRGGASVPSQHRGTMLACSMGASPDRQPHGGPM